MGRRNILSLILCLSLLTGILPFGLFGGFNAHAEADSMEIAATPAPSDTPELTPAATSAPADVSIQGLLQEPAPTPFEPVKTLTIPVSQDTYVQGGSSAGVAKGVPSSSDSYAGYYLFVRDWGDYPRHYALAYLKFNLPPASSFLNTDYIKAVKLRLYLSNTLNAANTNFVGISRLADFDENTLTYTQALKTDYTVKSNDYFDFTTKKVPGSDTELPRKPGWVEFDVTSTLKQCIASNTSSVVLTVCAPILQNTPENKALPIWQQKFYYYSKEYNNGQFAPQLYIDAAGSSEQNLMAKDDLYTSQAGDKAVNSDEIDIRHASSNDANGNPQNKDGFVSFDLSQMNMPAGASFQSAKVVLTAKSYPVLARSLINVDCVKPYDPNTIKWSAEPDTDTQLPPVDSFQTPYTKNQTVEIDVTNQVAAKLAGDKNLSLRLYSSEDMDADCAFYSLEAPEADYRPKLVYTLSYAAVFTSVKLSGQSSITVPDSGSVTVNYRAVFLDQFGSSLNVGGSPFNYYLVTPYPGISIDGNGNVTVQSTAAGGTVTIRAEWVKNSSMGDTFNINIIPPKPVSVKIKGSNMLELPQSGGSITSDYYAVITSSNGSVMTARPMTWALVQPVEGVSIDGNGRLQVMNNGNLNDGDKIKLRVSLNEDATIADTLEIELVKDPTTANITILPEADTYLTKSTNTNTNDTTLVIKNVSPTESTNREAYLRFDLSSLPYNIISAKLRLTTCDYTINKNGAPAVKNAYVDFVPNDAWNEADGSITAPLTVSGTTIAQSPVSSDKDASVEFDVTNQVKAEYLNDGKISLRVSQEQTGDSKTLTKFYSKEAAVADGSKPALIVTAKYRAVVSNVSISGPDSISVQQKPQNINYTVGVTDQYGNSVDSGSLHIDWSLQQSPEGVAFNGGTLTVDPSAQPGTVQLKAQVRELPLISRTYTVNIYKSAAATIILSGPTDIAVPQSGDIYQTFVGTTYDQYGKQIDEPVVYSLDAPQLGVSINAATGSVIVSDYAVSGRKFSVIATSKYNPSVRAEKAVNLRPSGTVRQHPYLIYNNEDLVPLRKKITVPPYSDLYSTMKQAANSMTSADLKQLEDNDWTWMATDMFYTFDTFQFTPPAGAVSVKLQCVAKGQGVTHFDDVVMSMVGSTQNIEVPNSSFEDGTDSPNGWTFGVDDNGSGSPKGEAQFKWDNQNLSAKKVVNKGIRSVMLNNLNPYTTSYVESSPIPVTPGVTYRATAAMGGNDKLIGPLGPLPEYSPMDPDARVYMRAVFLDSAGNTIGVEDYSKQAESAKGKKLINYKVKLLRRAFDMSMESAAAVYAIEKDTEYAQRAKYQLIYQLEDMEWGMKYIRTPNYNAKMNDSYEAVHIGRSLGRCSLVYDMIADSGVITPEEDALIRSYFYSIANRLRNDTNYYNTVTNVNNRKSNYNADRSTGLAMFAMVFPEFVDQNGATAADCLAYANGEIDWMLANSVMNDGMWGECMRYHNSVYSAWLAYGRAINRYDPTRDFLGQDKAKKMAEFYVNFIGPRLAFSTTSQNLAGYPTIADSAWREAMSAPGMAAAYYAKSDPELSKHLMYVWKNMGSVVSGYYLIDALLYLDASLPSERPNLSSTRLPYTGYTLFRKNYDEVGKEYLFIMNNEESLAVQMHDHTDRGSFQIFADSTPISIDPGVGGYFSDAGLYRATRGHNVVQFYDPNSSNPDHYADNSNAAGATKTEDIYTSQAYDFTKVKITSPAADSYERSVGFIKNGFDAFIIWDDLKSKNKSRFNLYIASTSFTLDGNVLTANCYNDMQLQVFFLNQKSPEISWDWKPVVSGIGLPEINGGQNQQGIFNYQPAGKDYLTVLYPKKRRDTAMTSEQWNTGSPVARAYKLQKGDKYFVVLTNEDDNAQTITLPNTEILRNIRTGEVIPVGANLTMAPHTMMVLLPDRVQEPAANKIDIKGNTLVGTPVIGNLSYKYTALVYDQYGNTMENAPVTFELASPVNGASIDSSGNLVVTKDVPAGTKLIVRAVSDGIASDLEVTVGKSGTQMSSVQIVGSSALVIPDSGINTYTYSAVITDSNGASVGGQQLVWSILNPTDGVKIDRDTGTVTVSANVPEKTVIAVNVTAKMNTYITQTREIVLLKAKETGLTIKGLDAVAVNHGKQTIIKYSADVTNQQGSIIPGIPVKWGIETPVDGVSVNADTGEVTIGPDVSVGTTFVLTAQSATNPANTDKKQITVIKNGPASIEIIGPDTVSISNNSTANIVYTAMVTDKNGAVMPGCSVAWSIPDNLGGVAIDGDGNLKVSSSAAAGDITIQASLLPDGTLKAAKKVSLKKQAESYGGGGVSGNGMPGGGAVSGGGFAPGTGQIEQNSHMFDDVPSGHWAINDIEALAAIGAVNGKAGRIFEPEGKVTRAEFVKMLVKAMNLKLSKPAKQFDDVQNGWYYEPVTIAQGLGIVNGVTESRFGVNELITRQQIAAILYRTLNVLGVKLNSSAANEAFGDEDEIDGYARDAVDALRAAGIIKGMDGNNFAPKEFATRAQAARLINALRMLAQRTEN